MWFVGGVILGCFLATFKYPYPLYYTMRKRHGRSSNRRSPKLTKSADRTPAFYRAVRTAAGKTRKSTTDLVTSGGQWTIRANPDKAARLLLAVGKMTEVGRTQ